MTTSPNKLPHTSVLLNEVVEGFRSVSIKVFVDGTLGIGGHAQAILESHPEIELFLGIDQDPLALEMAQKRLQHWGSKVQFHQDNFSHFDRYLNKLKPNGILVDLGVSSMQLDLPERGFSFSKEGPLDMRMDPNGILTAAEIVNTWPESDIGKIIRDFGEEKKWRAATRAIVEARCQQPIMTTTELANILRSVLPYNPKKGINPLTLVFQALRISVNKELEVLEYFMSKALDHLAPTGRMGVISFHSLEDRIVKNAMRFAADDKWDTHGIGGMFLDKEPTVKVLTRKPIIPTEEEVTANPRSRSAKLRIVEKL